MSSKAKPTPIPKQADKPDPPTPPAASRQRPLRIPASCEPAALTAPIPVQTAKPRAALTPIQEELADLCGDLIVSGGTPGDVNGLIEAALDHKFRAYLIDCGQTGEKLEQTVSRDVGKARETYLDALAAARALREKLPETERPQPATATDRVRAYDRGAVRELFDEFMTYAQPEEIHFLKGVLETRAQRQAIWEAPGFSKIEIAECFELETAGSHSYIRVPAGVADQVEAYVAAIVGDGDELPKARLDLIDQIFYHGLRVLDAGLLKNVLDFTKVAAMYHSNGVTPIEDFILELPTAQAQLAEGGRSLTPDLIARRLDDARDFWEDNEIIVKRTLEHNRPATASAV
jgi:hypothetical protein